MADFVHLHVHSHYSLLDSTVKVKDLVQRTAELGMDAVAITDHGNLYHCIDLQWASGAVRPIFGVEINLIPDRERAERARPHHLVLLAETLEGYKNLVRLVSMSWIRGLDRQGRPLVDYAELEQYAAGCIALTGDMGGEVPQHLLRGDADAATACLERYLRIFGRDNVFIELQRHEGLPEQQQACDALVTLARDMDVPYVATNNVHYLNEGDHEAHAILMCIGMDKRIDRSIIDQLPLTSLYLKSPDEMAELFADLPDAITNTRVIADRCQVEVPTGTYYLPRFDCPESMTEADTLRKLSEDGLRARFAQFDAAGITYDAAEYHERLEVELGIIIRMGYEGYFLIVADFIQWSQDNDIPVGPGRGSGAGSLVAYSLKITDLDPLPYGLLFERFLNPERVSMPDFDIDFCMRRRGEVIDYVTQKYGENNVAMIVTFGQLKAKAVVRDVARVLNMSYADADRLAKLVPNELNIKLAEAYAKEPRLREEVEGDETIRYLYDVGLALEGNNRNTGMHAAGVVISEDPLWEYVPISVGVNGELVSQYAKNEVEAAGLVKFDFLGLKTLTVIDDAERLVNQGRPDGEPLNWDRIGLDVPGVYKTITRGDTTGIFQMESEGFQRLIKQLKPDCFEDIVAAVALYRPGPLGTGMVDQFIDCKHGRAQVVYPHPWLEDVLRETYGVMVYQEQVMQVAQILAGYSLGGADLLRRAMGKKKKSEMDKQKAIFVEGASKNGIPETQSAEIFDLMAHFAGYGFNKSHSAAYAVLTFRTAYLKTYHPTEFYASLMTNDAGSTDKVVKYIVDARSRGIQVLPPNVNHSDESFSVADGAIRFGLGAVKGIGSGPIEAIIEARADGPFASLYDFCERVDSKRVNKRVVEALVRCGAFDDIFPEAADVDERTLARIGSWRARLHEAVDGAFGRGQKAQRDKAAGQASLFGMFAEAMPVEVSADTYPEATLWDARTVLQHEKDTLGFYVSGHPLDRYKTEIKRFADVTTESLNGRSNRDRVHLAAVISAKREMLLKSGKGRMAFLQLEDHYGECEGVVYSRVFDEVAELLDTDEPLLVSGTVRIDNHEDEPTRKIAIDALQPLWQARSQHVSSAVIELESSEVDERMIAALSRVLAGHPGHCRAKLRIHFGTADVDVDLGDEVLVAATDELVHEVMAVLGDDRLRFR